MNVQGSRELSGGDGEGEQGLKEGGKCRGEDGEISGKIILGCYYGFRKLKINGFGK